MAEIKDAISEAKVKLYQLQDKIAALCKEFQKETGLRIESPGGINLIYHGSVENITGCRVRVSLPWEIK